MDPFRRKELVLDDVVCLKTGDQVPADARILEGSLEVNESITYRRIGIIFRRMKETTFFPEVL